MKYTKVRVNKTTVVHLQGTWSKAEVKSYIKGLNGGPTPQFVKVKVDKNFNGRRALMHIVGYRIINVVANKNGRVTTVVFKKRKES